MPPISIYFRSASRSSEYLPHSYRSLSSHLQSRMAGEQRISGIYGLGAAGKPFLCDCWCSSRLSAGILRKRNNKTQLTRTRYFP